jgi:hypothetical protein
VTLCPIAIGSPHVPYKKAALLREPAGNSKTLMQKRSHETAAVISVSNLSKTYASGFQALNVSSGKQHGPPISVQK